MTDFILNSLGKLENLLHVIFLKPFFSFTLMRVIHAFIIETILLCVGAVKSMKYFMRVVCDLISNK